MSFVGGWLSRLMGKVIFMPNPNAVEDEVMLWFVTIFLRAHGS